MRANDWSMPQHEYAGRVTLPEPVLHARRERVFLVLAALFLATSLVVPLVGLERVFGVSGVLRSVGLVTPEVPLLLPLAIVAWPLGLAAASLASELYGGRRARMLVLVGLVLQLGVLGLHWATDHVADYEGTTTQAFAPALALAAAWLVGTIVQLAVLRVLGRRGLALRYLAASILGLAAGWGAFVALDLGLGLVPAREGFSADAQLTGLVAAAAGYGLLAAIVALVPVAIAARALAVHLRVDRGTQDALADDDEPLVLPPKKRPAFIVETPVPGSVTASGVRRRGFTTEELAFFDAGDQLAASDSFTNLPVQRER